MNQVWTNFRYGRVEEDPKKSRLFLICNPVSRVGKQVAYLQLWDPVKGRFSRSAQSDESLSALAVRDDGRFVAVGTMFTGTVDVYIAFSLQVIYKIDCTVQCGWFQVGYEFSFDGAMFLYKDTCLHKLQICVDWQIVKIRELTSTVQSTQSF